MKFLRMFPRHGGKNMSSIRTISASSPVPDDLAKRLGPNGVDEILFTIWQGFYDLKSDDTICINENAEEDDITLELYGKITKLWGQINRATSIQLNSIGPVHQYPDPTLKKKHGYKPTIDFCFRDWDTSNSYFGAECKNLYKNKKDKIKRYVTTGVNNYTTGRYGSQSTESSIIGYVLSGNISEIVDELINEISNVNPISNLSRELRYKDPQYLSRHKRDLDKKEITIHHLFFDFCH